jgi:hypothetical protein
MLFNRPRSPTPWRLGCTAVVVMVSVETEPVQEWRDVHAGFHGGGTQLWFEMDSERRRANSLHKLDTLITALRLFRKGLEEVRRVRPA